MFKPSKKLFLVRKSIYLKYFIHDIKAYTKHTPQVYLKCLLW